VLPVGVPTTVIFGKVDGKILINRTIVQILYVKIGGSVGELDNGFQNKDKALGRKGRLNRLKNIFSKDVIGHFPGFCTGTNASSDGIRKNR